MTWWSAVIYVSIAAPFALAGIVDLTRLLIVTARARRLGITYKELRRASRDVNRYGRADLVVRGHQAQMFFDSEGKMRLMVKQ